MPRPERPLDDHTGAIGEFAADLRLLREKAGSPGYRELARRAHYSATTLSDAAGGRRLPTLAVTLAYVEACGGDRAEWEDRWHITSTRLTAVERVPGFDPDNQRESPYAGLAAFQPEDADRFFGRERLVDDLVSQVDQHRFLAVFGASGAGKSSLLRAGLISRTRKKGQLTVLLTPGPHPLEECAARLAGLTGESARDLNRGFQNDPRGLHLSVLQAAVPDQPAIPDQPGSPEPHSDLLLVVDQFEEIFTLCRDADERDRFITALTTAAQAGNSRIRVVLGIRADFYARCSEIPELVTVLRHGQFPVGPMTTDEIRRAVVQPAVDAECSVEGALLAQITADATGQAGVLPLVSHAMRETWQRRRGNTLTLVGYQSAGGIKHALAHTAEMVHSDLTARQQQLCQSVFLRLTALGEGTEDTKRRITSSELDTTDPDTHAVLEALARARLITLDHDTVEITHEALIRSWPRLRGWLDEDREGLRIHRELTEATTAWEVLDHDPGALYRGTRLAVTQEWEQRDGRSLTPRERAFLDASAAARTHEQRATQRRNRQLYWLSIGLTVLLLLVSGIATGGENQRRATTARMLAAQAEAIATTNTGSAIRHSLSAYDSYPSADTRSTLLSLAGHPNDHGRLPHVGGEAPSATSFSPDGRTLATAERGHVALWSSGSHVSLGELRPGDDPEYSTVDFTANGRKLAAGRRDGRVDLWDVPTSTRSDSGVAAAGPIRGVQLSPDGKFLFLSRENGRAVELWGLGSRRQVDAFAEDRDVWSPALSPDGRVLAYATSGGLTAWDVRERRRLDLPGAREPISSVAFSPEGDELAAAKADHSLSTWDLGNGTVRDFPASSGPISDVDFTPDARTVVSTGFDNTVTLWNVDQPEQRRILTANEPGGLLDVEVGSDGTIAALSRTSTLLWDIGRLPYSTPEPSAPFGFNPRGKGLIGVGHGGSGNAGLLTWDPERGRDPNRTPLDTPPATHTALSSDSRRAGFSDGNTISVFDVTSRARIAELAAPAAERIVFSPDGTLLATAESSGRVGIWNLAEQRRITILNGPPGEPSSLAISGNNRFVATNNSGGATQLWDMSSGKPVPYDGSALAFSEALAFSPDGQSLAAVARRSVTMIDPGSAAHRGAGDSALLDSIGPTESPTSATFSPDGRFLAIATDHGRTVIWDVANKTHWATLSGQTGQIRQLAWNSTSTELAASSTDQTITVWPIIPENATARLCGALASDYPGATGPPPVSCAS